jgi:hypothetical protein
LRPYRQRPNIPNRPRYGRAEDAIPAHFDAGGGENRLRRGEAVADDALPRLGLAATSAAIARASAGASGTGWRQNAPHPARHEIVRLCSTSRAAPRSASALDRQLNSGSRSVSGAGPDGTVTVIDISSSPRTTVTAPVITGTSAMRMV